LLLGRVVAGGAELVVVLHEQDLGTDALEGDDARLARLAAVEPDVVRAQPCRQRVDVEEGGSEVFQLEPEDAFARVPVQVEEARQMPS